MKKAYLAISYNNRKSFDNEVRCLVEVCNQENINLIPFVDKYNFKPNEEKIMMQTAFKEIDKSDFLIAELTTKSIGVGIEIGYAYAKQKPIIYFRKRGSEYSTTASGSATFTIEYKSIKELRESMKEVIEVLKTGLRYTSNI